MKSMPPFPLLDKTMNVILVKAHLRLSSCAFALKALRLLLTEALTFIFDSRPPNAIALERVTSA